MRVYLGIAVLGLALGLPATAAAQNAPKGLTASGSLGLAVANSFDSLHTNSTTSNYQGQVAYLVKNVIGVEVVGDLTPGLFLNGVAQVKGVSYQVLSKNPRVTTVVFNVIGSIPMGANHQFQPYGSVGGGVMRFSSDALAATTLAGAPVGATVSTSASKTAFDLGGGFVEYLKPNVGLRIDLRYYRALGTLDRGDSGGLTTLPSPSGAATAYLNGMDFVRVNFGIAVRW